VILGLLIAGSVTLGQDSSRLDLLGKVRSIYSVLGDVRPGEARIFQVSAAYFK
jgi:hypothetical protein